MCPSCGNFEITTNVEKYIGDLLTEDLSKISTQCKQAPADQILRIKLAAGILPLRPIKYSDLALLCSAPSC